MEIRTAMIGSSGQERRHVTPSLCQKDGIHSRVSTLNMMATTISKFSMKDQESLNGTLKYPSSNAQFVRIIKEEK